MRSREAMIKYLFARFQHAFAVRLRPVGGRLYPAASADPRHLAMIAALAAAGIGYIAPGYYLKNVAQKRAKKMTLALPDALTCWSSARKPGSAWIPR